MALSLLIHCTILVLAAFAAAGHRAMVRAPKPMLIALDNQPAAAPAPAFTHPTPARARHKPVAQPRQASPAPTGTAAVPEPPAPVPSPADQQPPEAPAPAAVVDAAAFRAPPEPPPLLYLAEVSRLIRLRLDYPARARLDRAQGTAVVHILLARDGTVLGVDLIQGAGHPALDEEARAVVLRIHKFPELPDAYARGEQRFAIDQPIGFRET